MKQGSAPDARILQGIRPFFRAPTRLAQALTPVTRLQNTYSTAKLPLAGTVCSLVNYPAAPGGLRGALLYCTPLGKTQG
ncbi:hypothetical protein CRM93_07790 [Acetobacter fabarum]|uniref:Uncharacterized protein n=1 Tax=Acetobacter fabarum TaxID=483199 RepID=A0A269XZD1_9PROT|nr:hypothetical protein B8X00_05845 [Acetobacter fabarum]PEN26375.1 hypothetical protein CRM93_07790 [Acetobacter fabarum]